MVRGEELKAGDVLLFRRDSTFGVYSYVKHWIEKVFEDNLLAKVAVDTLLEYLANQLRHQYAHAELYLGSGYSATVYFDGLVVYRLPIHILSLADVYRPTFAVDQKQLIDLVYQHIQQYDFASYLLNVLIKIIALGDEEKEKTLAAEFSKYYVNPNRFTCSEFVARVFARLGQPLVDKVEEYVTPDDLARSSKLYWLI